MTKLFATRLLYVKGLRESYEVDIREPYVPEYSNEELIIVKSEIVSWV